MNKAELRPSEIKNYKMFINGEWVDSNSGETITCTDPFNQAPWATVPRATSHDVDNAVMSARRAFNSPEWNSLGPLQRAQLLRNLAQLIETKIASRAIRPS